MKLDTLPNSTDFAARETPMCVARPTIQHRDSHEHPAAAGRESRTAEITRREQRIDRIETGKSALWRTDLRISQAANVVILVLAGGFLMWQDWSPAALAPACIFAVGGMWAIALRMRPREARLCRHMMFLARHRRRCVMCRYCVQGIASDRCPECGFEFDITDTRHLLIPELNRTYSQQGRQVGAVAIVAVMIGMTLITQRANWQYFFLWSLGLLSALHALYFWWMLSAKDTTDMNSPANEHETDGSPIGNDHSDSNRDSSTAKGILKYQYLALLLRWAFLTALVIGIHVNLSAGNAWIPTHFGKTGAVASIVARLSIWVITVAFVTSTIGRRIRHAGIVAIVKPN